MERGDRFIMSKDEDSNYHLMIKDVLPTDAGQYSCKLANFAGKASCSAELRVEGQDNKKIVHVVVCMAKKMLDEIEIISVMES